MPSSIPYKLSSEAHNSQYWGICYVELYPKVRLKGTYPAHLHEKNTIYKQIAGADPGFQAREARKFLGYFVWKITILRQKIIFSPILWGRAPGAPPWIRPWLFQFQSFTPLKNKVNIAPIKHVLPINDFNIWIWYIMDLQLPVKSVPFTSTFVSSNTVHGEMFSIQH